MTGVTWHGTPEECFEWTQVLVRLMEDCECRESTTGVMGSTVAAVNCSAHVAGQSDQQWLDRLVFQRRRWPDAGKREEAA